MHRHCETKSRSRFEESGEANLEPNGAPTTSTCDCVCTVRTCRYPGSFAACLPCCAPGRAQLRACLPIPSRAEIADGPPPNLGRPGSICGFQLHQNTTTKHTRPSPQPDDLHYFRAAEDVFAVFISHPTVALAPRHRTPAPDTVAALRPVCARPPPRRQPSPVTHLHPRLFRDPSSGAAAFIPTGSHPTAQRLRFTTRRDRNHGACLRRRQPEPA